MPQIALLAIGIVVLGVLFTGVGRDLWIKTRNYLTSDGPDDGPKGVPLINQPSSWIKLTERKALRSTQLQLQEVKAIGINTGVKSYTSPLIIDYDPTLPLARSASLKSDGYLIFPTIIGHPATIAVFSWIIQYLNETKGLKNFNHLGCFNNTANAQGWHNYGCAIDIPNDWKDSALYCARVLLNLAVQWCDQDNKYWASDQSQAGASIHSTCHGNHTDHLHLEITPDYRAWRMLNHVGLKVTKHA